MTPIYLKFPNETTADSVLNRQVPTAWDTEGDPTAFEPVPNYVNVSVIGVMYEKQEILDPENPPEPVALDGWHVNVLLVDGEDREPLSEYEIVPEHPRRMWSLA